MYNKRVYRRNLKNTGARVFDSTFLVDQILSLSLWDLFLKRKSLPKTTSIEIVNTVIENLVNEFRTTAMDQLSKGDNRNLTIVKTSAIFPIRECNDNNSTRCLYMLN